MITSYGGYPSGNYAKAKAGVPIVDIVPTPVGLGLGPTLNQPTAEHQSSDIRSANAVNEWLKYRIVEARLGTNLGQIDRSTGACSFSSHQASFAHLKAFTIQNETGCTSTNDHEKSRQVRYSQMRANLPVMQDD
eukprot:486874-Pleurochrysis_carterae.AAC.2